MSGRFKGKTAIITGGGTGIGAATVAGSRLKGEGSLMGRRASLWNVAARLAAVLWAMHPVRPHQECCFEMQKISRWFGYCGL